MGATPTLLLPYPELTDPADVPADVKRLADRIEAVRGIANGLASLGADGLIPPSQLPNSGRMVASLPPSPRDGDIVTLVDNFTTPTYAWVMQWNATAARWVWTGGVPFYAYYGPDEATTAVSVWQDLTIGGLTFTTPRAGQYFWRFGHTGYNTTAAGYAAMGIWNGVGIGPPYAQIGNGTAGQSAAVAVAQRTAGLGAGAVIKAQYQAVFFAVAHFGQRWLEVRPDWLT